MSDTKKTKKNTEINKPEVVEKTDQDVDDGQWEKSPAQRETETENDNEKEPLIFTIEVNGEEIELEDRWDREQPPGALMFMGGSETMGMKYVGKLAEQIIGEDQVMKILDAGGDATEMSETIHAWRKARGLGNG